MTDEELSAIEERAARVYPEDSGWNGTEAEDALPIVTEDVPALVAEVRRLRSIVEGRTTAPTREEIAAHRKAIRKAAGAKAEAWWLVIDEDGHVDALTTHLAVLQRRWQRGRGVAVPVRWWPLDDGRPCAWPVVPSP